MPFAYDGVLHCISEKIQTSVLFLLQMMAYCIAVLKYFKHAATACAVFKQQLLN